jgi:hypothetical protein
MIQYNQRVFAKIWFYSLIPFLGFSGISGAATPPPILPQASISPKTSKTIDFVTSIEQAWALNSAFVLQFILLQDAFFKNKAILSQVTQTINLINGNANNLSAILSANNVKNYETIGDYFSLHAKFPINYYIALINPNCSTSGTPAAILEQWQELDELFALLLNNSLPSIDFAWLQDHFDQLRSAYIGLVSHLHHNQINVNPRIFARIDRLHTAIAHQIALRALSSF